MKRLSLISIAGGLFAFAVASLGSSTAILSEDAPAAAPDMPLAGQLQAPAFWAAYKARFLTADGRIVDDLNGGISHSEGQGYGLVLAVAADDRAAFDRILAWTRANLFVRDDYLVAWRFAPAHKPNVPDRNDAADGDLLIAWALVEAADHWNDAAYRSLARHMARAIVTTLLANTEAGRIVRSGATGFDATDRADGPVVNLSYWVFPALKRLAKFDGDAAWGEAIRTSVKLVEASRFGPLNLPTDWISLKAATPQPAHGFPAVFGYNALRIPLYLSWAGLSSPKTLGPYVEAWKTGRPAIVEVATGRETEVLTSPGYRALAAFVGCATSNRRFDDDLRQAPVDNYYPSTLSGLVMITIHERYPQCW